MLAAAACASASFASPAGAALIGPRDVSADAFAGAYAGVPTCTYSAVQLPEGSVRSPISGTITRWRVHVPAAHDTLVNDGPLRLQVLKRIVNQPGIVNDEFKAIRETPDQAVTPIGKQAFNTDLRIRKGQFIGLVVPDDTEVGSGAGSPAYLFEWCPELTPGDPGGPADFTVPDEYLLFNATVKP